ncbi:RNA-binding protein NOB1 isoform X1 [Coffea eugenioides]|uniref:RNA-binding protein NOB1 isoform X1 n=1 Tax=Coffea eugenioides TaxID=49369 RepID=UPI000F60A6A9|nr:RNA-binding protein NOB1 isoform X1 [Coffea eugenioides]
MEVQASPQPIWSNLLKHQPPPVPDHLSATSSAPPKSTQGLAVGSCKSTKGIAVAVVDANALIQGGQSLAPIADRFVSVSEVISEIRDPTSRHSLNCLPFSVDTLEPSPDALKKVIHFARATGDLQTLSDVDLKLIALTYTLEAQTHGTQHLRDSPPPIHTVSVKKLPEKDMPGWGSNVPNLEEWEALEHVAEDESNYESKILPLKDLSLNVVPKDQHMEDGLTGHCGECHSENQEVSNGNLRRQKKYSSKKVEVKVEGKKMVADGIDATKGEFGDDVGDWLPAVSRSTRRRYLRRKARRELHGALSDEVVKDDASHNVESGEVDDTQRPELLAEECAEEVADGSLGENATSEVNDNDKDVSAILHQMHLDEESSVALHADEDLQVPSRGLISNDFEATSDNSESAIIGGEGEVTGINGGLDNLSLNSERIGASLDDNSSEQSWMLRSLSESSVACVTSDYAMQNVILQMGLRLLAPGGMQIRELHRWVLKCHACYKVTTDIGRVFCPNCGNGGTLRKVAVTVGENGIILAARRPRVSVRGTKFSLPLPQGGRDAITKNPILREDQLPQKFLYPKTKKKNKQVGDDIFASDDIFIHHTDKRAPLQPPVRKALAVFSGKRNPNDNHFSRAKH